MTKLLLIDGSNYLFRAFHALPPLTTSRGEPTGALKGFRSMIQSVFQSINPDYAACVFDAHAKNFRHAIYPQYKANRPPMPDELRIQLEPIHEMVKLLGWPLLQIEGVEADDVLATLAKQAASEGTDVFVATGDKDLAQIVEPRVSLVNTMTHEILNREEVHEKYGVYPEKIVDYLSLMGDKVDNIPGINKCGPKTAAKWIDQYGDLQGVIEASGTISGKIGEYLRAGIPFLGIAKQLVTINCNVDLGVKFQDLSVVPASSEEQAKFFLRWEMKSALKSNGRNGRASVPAQEGNASDQGNLFPFQNVPAQPASEMLMANGSFQLVDDETKLAHLVSRLNTVSDDVVGVSFLAENSAPMFDKALAVGFCVTPLEVYIVPIGLRASPVFPSEVLKQALGSWFSSDAPKVFHDSKYAKHILKNMGITLGGRADDSMLMSYVLESHLKHDLTSVALRHLSVEVPNEETLLGKGVGKMSADSVSLSEASVWLAKRVVALKTLRTVLTEKLTRDEKLERIYKELELPIRDILWKMERFGVSIDSVFLSEQSSEIACKIEEIKKQITDLAGETFNPSSPKQLSQILFEKLQLPVLKKTSSGTPSTDEEVLADLALDYPLPKRILEYRKFMKLKGTYTDKLPLMVDLRDNRVHTTFGQATAVTGRLASSDPNLQNIPVRTPEGRRVRAAFVSRAGSKIISADYSQIELRIMAHLSEDKGLIESFASGKDVHRATAAEVFGVRSDLVTADQRRMAKVINFGLIYGMSSFGLAKNLGIERTAAKRYMDEYFARYPGVFEYMNRVREEAKRNGFVCTAFGRRLWLPDLASPRAQVRAAAERAAINAPVQGTAADVIKLAMIAVDKWLSEEQLESRMILQVHDELVLEVPVPEVEIVSQKLPDLMAQVAAFRVPLVAEVGIADNWEAAH